MGWEDDTDDENGKKKKRKMEWRVKKMQNRRQRTNLREEEGIDELRKRKNDGKDKSQKREQKRIKENGMEGKK